MNHTKPGSPEAAAALVLPLEAVGLEALADVGGKNASLGEMIRELRSQGVCVPGGFATTAAAYRQFMDSAGLESRLHAILDGVDGHDIGQLQAAGAAARALLLGTPLPEEIQKAILSAYRQLGGAAVAVRSSATAEDLPDASFAGQQETYLNVQGEAALLAACQRCYASLFTDRAISYRQINGYSHFDVALSIGVQHMVRSDLACSGVMFSIDTETGFRDAVLLTAAYGLGENVVQGAVNPDEYLVFKPTLEQGFAPIVSQRLGSKAIRMVYGEHGSTRNVDVPEPERRRYALQESEVLQPSHANGYRMGQRWGLGRTVHPAGAARNGGITPQRNGAAHLAPGGTSGRAALPRSSDWGLGKQRSSPSAAPPGRNPTL